MPRSPVGTHPDVQPWRRLMNVNLVLRRVHKSGTDSRKGEGRGSLYSNRYTVTTRMISALMRVSDVSHFKVSFLLCKGKVTRQCSVHKSQFWKRKVSRSGESNRRPSAYRQPSALTTRPSRLTLAGRAGPLTTRPSRLTLAGRAGLGPCRATQPRSRRDHALLSVSTQYQRE